MVLSTHTTGSLGLSFVGRVETKITRFPMTFSRLVASVPGNLK